MSKRLIAHSSKNDVVVRAMQQALGDHAVIAWIDSRELLPGGLLDPDVAKEIDEGAAYAVAVSPGFAPVALGRQRTASRARKCVRSSIEPVLPGSPITSSTLMVMVFMIAASAWAVFASRIRRDIGKLDQRRHVIVTTEELGPFLRDHRIPLVFLEACQTGG